MLQDAAFQSVSTATQEDSSEFSSGSRIQVPDSPESEDSRATPSLFALVFSKSHLFSLRIRRPLAGLSAATHAVWLRSLLIFRMRGLRFARLNSTERSEVYPGRGLSSSVTTIPVTKCRLPGPVSLVLRSLMLNPRPRTLRLARRAKAERSSVPEKQRSSAYLQYRAL